MLNKIETSWRVREMLEDFIFIFYTGLDDVDVDGKT